MFCTKRLKEKTHEHDYGERRNDNLGQATAFTSAATATLRGHYVS